MRCYHICIIKISPISLCSHPDMHHYSDREVCHSLTWHSSESESALKRFEPVAWLSYSRTVGALCSHRPPRGDRKSLKEGLTHMRSMCVGVAEMGVNSFLFLSFSFFSDKRKEHYEKSIFILLTDRGGLTHMLRICVNPRKLPKTSFFFLFILYSPQKNYFRPTGFAQIRKGNMISYSRGGYFGKSKADDGADRQNNGTERRNAHDRGQND